MPDYDLSPDSVEDLEAIFVYTIDRWGVEQAYRYKNKLTQHFSEFGKGKAISRAFIKSFPELQVSRCEHHYVFHFARKGKVPLIIAILHERMDLVSRVRRRLEG